VFVVKLLPERRSGSKTFTETFRLHHTTAGKTMATFVGARARLQRTNGRIHHPQPLSPTTLHVEVQDKLRVLGVMQDSSLSLDSHVSEIVKIIFTRGPYSTPVYWSRVTLPIPSRAQL
jgi:hypothetical protein